MSKNTILLSDLMELLATSDYKVFLDADNHNKEVDCAPEYSRVKSISVRYVNNKMEYVIKFTRGVKNDN